MKLEYIGYVLKHLRQRKLRSWLTVLGILIGFATVISLYAIGQGLQTSIQEQFEELGGNKIIVQERGFGAGATVPQAVIFREGDVKTVSKTRGVERAVGYYVEGADLVSNDETQAHFIMGMPTKNKEDLALAIETFTVKVAEGRNIEVGDTSSVVLGARYAIDNDLFEKRINVRDRVLINGLKFKVVGIYETLGNPTDDSNIYVGQDAIENIFGIKDEFSFIMGRVQEGFDPATVALQVEDELRDFRDLDEGKEDFFVQTFEQLIQTFTDVLNVVKIVLILIALVSLIVGIVNIMNTMYTAVLERTPEIGLMKAVGATNKDIRDIFLIESGIIGFIGGAAGVIIGYALAQGMATIAAAAGFTILRPFFPWWLMIGSLVTALLVGIFSGVLPAIQAAQLKPVEALRYE